MKNSKLVKLIVKLKNILVVALKIIVVVVNIVELALCNKELFVAMCDVVKQAKANIKAVKTMSKAQLIDELEDSIDKLADNFLDDAKLAMKNVITSEISKDNNK